MFPVRSPERPILGGHFLGLEPAVMHLRMLGDL